MYTLDRPEFEDSPETIYEKCVKRYRRGSDKYVRLLPCKDLVKRDTDRYEELIQAGNAFPQPVLPGGMQPADMHCVYEEKFAKSGTDGRKEYYNKIMKLVQNKSCPVCGGNGKITLDHFLPKRQYPTLCVAPDNLIPICHSCNSAKDEKCAALGFGTPVHLYFDRLPTKEDGSNEYIEAFLFVRLGPNCEAEYYVECPQEWDALLRGRLADQMEIYDLVKRFAGFAATETGHLETSWRQNVKILRETWVDDPWNSSRSYTDREIFEKHLRVQFRQAQIRDANSWETALYRAWYENAGKLLDWLETREPNARKTCK